jgi:hypothetical protein
MSDHEAEPARIDADALLGGTAVEAGVQALAARNHHHLAAMEPQEREEATSHWRELTVEVLSAARAALAEDRGPDVEGGGRAVIVFEDAGGEDVNVHVTFAPQLEELSDGMLAGTPAQLAAMSLLEAMAQGGEGPEGPFGE